MLLSERLRQLREQRAGELDARIVRAAKGSAYSRRERDRDYMAWIKTHPCLICKKRRNVEAAHVNNEGLSRKCSDRRTLPICIMDHREGKHSLDKNKKAFWIKHGIDPEREIERLNRLYDSQAQ